MIWVPWRLLVLVHCVLSSPESMQPSTRRFWSRLFGDADFLFQCDFITCPQWQNHFQGVCWPLYYCTWLASQHAWPEPHVEYMGSFQEKDEKQLIQQYRWVEGSIVPRQCHSGLNEPRPSTECINEHTLNNLNFSVLQILFLMDLRKYSNILRYWMFHFHEL